MAKASPSACVGAPRSSPDATTRCARSETARQADPDPSGPEDHAMRSEDFRSIHHDRVAPSDAILNMLVLLVGIPSSYGPVVQSARARSIRALVKSLFSPMTESTVPTIWCTNFVSSGCSTMRPPEHAKTAPSAMRRSTTDSGIGWK